MNGRRWLEALYAAETGLLVALLVVTVGLSFAQIVLRNLFEAGLPWADPLLRIMVLWLGLLGALTASRSNRHITVDVLSPVLSEKALAIVGRVTAAFTSVVSAVLAFYSLRFLQFDLGTTVTALGGLPLWMFEIILPVAFGLIALRYALRVFA